jgi:hypothetical protein
MAKFKVGEKARYVALGKPCHGLKLKAGHECVVVDALAVRQEYSNLRNPLEPRYGIAFKDGVQAWVLETSLEKLVPKHQLDDLKAAEPQFIPVFNRWLKQEEKQYESEKAE